MEPTTIYALGHESLDDRSISRKPMVAFTSEEVAKQQADEFLKCGSDVYVHRMILNQELGAAIPVWKHVLDSSTGCLLRCGEEKEMSFPWCPEESRVYK